MRLAHNIGHGSDVGRQRPLNEDYHRVWKFPVGAEELILLAVADGMGGAAAGEVASKMATEVLDESFSRYVDAMRTGQDLVSISALIERATKLANRRVHAIASSDTKKRGMGTTLTAIAIWEGKAYLGHVGDSRAYLLRGDKIYQLTKDHSWVEAQIEKGLLNEEQAKNHEWRNLITRALGTRPTVSPDIIEIDIKEGDIFVLCSDGLHSYLNPEEIMEEVMRVSSSRQAAVENMLQLANERGGHDNITVIIAEVE